MKDKNFIIKVICSILCIISIGGILLGCDKNPPFDNEVEIDMTNQEITMPTLDIIGSLNGISKTNTVTVSANYKDSNTNFLDTKTTLKLQGTGSIKFDKKNFTIKFGSGHKLVKSWGKQKKYCLKANYIDYSQLRNVVSAKIYGQIVKDRDIDDEFKDLVNGGAIDGYPILLTLNGNFLGLYTLNIPKDEWMFKMEDETKKQAILMGDDWTETASLKKQINGEFSKDVELIDGVQLEYNSKEDDEEYAWITESFNSMIEFLNQEQTKENFKLNLPNYINVERAIDSMLYSLFIYADDNRARNILWVTYDGDVWTPSVYDLDSTWGNHWDGTISFNPQNWLPNQLSNCNLLWQKLYENYYDEIKARYLELRQNILTLDNIANNFISFDNLIPSYVRTWEKTKWKDVPSNNVNYISQILYFSALRLNTFDNFFANN